MTRRFTFIFAVLTSVLLIATAALATATVAITSPGDGDSFEYDHDDASANVLPIVVSVTRTEGTDSTNGALCGLYQLTVTVSDSDDDSVLKTWIIAPGGGDRLAAPSGGNCPSTGNSVTDALLDGTEDGAAATGIATVTGSNTQRAYTFTWDFDEAGVGDYRIDARVAYRTGNDPDPEAEEVVIDVWAQDNGGNGVTVDNPAAPSVAARLLRDAGIDNRYGKGRNGGNYIADVAATMSPGTSFNGVSKDDVDDYRCAVAQYLNDHPQFGKDGHEVSEQGCNSA